jgi:hypothetical protein
MLDKREHSKKQGKNVIITRCDAIQFTTMLQTEISIQT